MWIPEVADELKKLQIQHVVLFGIEVSHKHITLHHPVYFTSFYSSLWPSSHIIANDRVLTCICVAVSSVSRLCFTNRVGPDR
jgi:hypothetical protein